MKKKKIITLSMAFVMALLVAASPLSSKAYGPPRANPAKNRILAPKTVAANRTFTLKLKGDRESAKGYRIGETKFTPYSWRIGNLYSYVYIDYEHHPRTYVKRLRIKAPGTYRIRAAFIRSVLEEIERWGERDWDDDDNYLYRKSKIIRVKGKVKFKAGYGRLPDNKKTKYLYQHQKIGKLPVPGRSGYAFRGWYAYDAWGNSYRIKSYTKINFHGYPVKYIYAKWVAR